MTLLHRLAALCLLAVAAFPALAISEKDLLPVDQAFALSAQAPERGRIALHWDIAKGYYLYRHRIAVKVIGARTRLNAESGVADPGTSRVQLEVRYQGCADAGVERVLPILSLKVLGLAQSGESRGRARSHALWYTLGVLASFAVVGGIAVAARLLWGFLRASSRCWCTCRGLSLSGVFTLSANLGGVGPVAYSPQMLDACAPRQRVRHLQGTNVFDPRHHQAGDAPARSRPGDPGPGRASVRLGDPRACCRTAC
ncbi:protein-disulfide reductase DsbD N-terminal domain-containing protein [Pantoea ananatis]|uniref:protein-disulfide reductase DsbD N-terminal domain-containing protein n=1 Tax=Pantoea ananas TaxID=553 RepID=UPI0022211489|nr:protein-disulfide reductase DsbD N-terminal domain-containing protein [Pantoea ananatis]